MGKTIVLASSSPRRQELLRNIGLPFKVIVREVDEQVPGIVSAPELVRLLAVRKARAVGVDHAITACSSLIIGADTVVVCDGKVLGKPRDRDEASQMLALLEGRTHEVYTGVALLEMPADKEIVFHELTKVRFRPISGREIDSYIETGEPLDKAGAYGIQGLGGVFVEGIDGCYFNVVGLPVSRLTERLKSFGISIF